MTLLRVENVTKTFGGLMAVNDVSLSVAAGEILGLIGPNGAGKTSLFNVIAGFLKPTSGAVYFEDQRIDRRTVAQICRRGLARTFQVVRPFGEMSVKDNVLVGGFVNGTSRADAEARTREVLKHLGMEEQANQPANSLTLAGRKRLELARVLATRPKLLLVDEVMAGLNGAEMAEVLGILSGLRDDGISVIMVEHNMPAVLKVSDRIAVLHFGHKIADSSPAEIVKNQTVIEAYIGKDHSNA